MRRRSASVSCLANSFAEELPMIPEEQGCAHGGGMPDAFRRFLELHPGMSIEEALHRFRDEQKAKQRRQGPKLH